MKEPLLMRLENNVYLDGGRLVMVDRREIPREIRYVVTRNYKEVAQAIKDMVVQGAGDIAITAGFGLYLAAREQEDANGNCHPDNLAEAAATLRDTRPTGFHMAVLLEKALQRVQEETDRASEVILRYLKELLTRQDNVSRATGECAEPLLESGDTILTHCFAGAGLLYMLKYAKENGKDIKVICTETRPYLQGARLTSWSISQLGLETILITDNMAAHIMSQGMIDKVFTAADRIAMDGTVANKVGTLQLAIAARFYTIPFYILGYGGVDTRTLRGTDIPIEQRDPKEVLEFQGVAISGEGVKGLYPAFDLTPRDLITGVVTKSGIILND